MWGVSVADMSVKKNATFAAHEAASFDVSQSLTICKQLLEHSWQSYNNEHYHLVWQEALDTAIEGCKGLLTMSTEQHVQELKQEAHMWFVLFLTFTGISLTAVAALVYLISTMRTFVSLRKCLVSTWESRESRPNPQSLINSLQSPLSTRPVIQNWATPRAYSRLHHRLLDTHTHHSSHRLALLYNIRSTILYNHQNILWPLLLALHSQE